MVTHNPELAKSYATRIVSIKDGTTKRYAEELSRRTNIETIATVVF